MKRYFFILFSIILIACVGGVGYFLLKEEVNYMTLNEKASPIILQNNDNNEINNIVTLIDFSRINPEFLFSAKITKELKAEYISQLRTVNIYKKSMSGKINTEESQIYITLFKANKFLTLNTVEITQQDKIYINDKEAILYEIIKKETVPNFIGQPSWRNIKHKAIDVRYSKDNPSYFYSFAKNPDLSQKIFDEFINSLVFINN